jgi:hypothetical protein
MCDKAIGIRVGSSVLYDTLLVNGEHALEYVRDLRN